MTDSDDTNDLYECTACGTEEVPFEGMRCLDCYVGTTDEFLFEYVPEVAVGGDPDQADLPNIRVAAVSGAHIVMGVYDRKGGEHTDYEPAWLDQMLHTEQAKALRQRLAEAIEATDDIQPDERV